MRHYAPDDEILGNRNLRYTCRIQFADVLGGDPLVLGHNDLTAGVAEIETRHLATQTFRHEMEFDALLAQFKRVEIEELAQNLFRRQPDCLEQGRDRHLATAIDAEKQNVFRVELEIEPGATVGNHARREQKLTRTVGLAAIVLEKYAG